MIPRRAFLPLSLVLALPAAMASVAHCGSRLIDAVDVPDAGTALMAADAGSTVSDDAATAQLIWPNPASSTNSDRWIVDNHDKITQMRPKVLVLDYYNPWSVQQAQSLAQGRIQELAEGSRYHGYLNWTVLPFLNYALLPIINLTDNPAPPPGGSRSASKLLPTDASGAFDMGLLFAQTFAADPANPSQMLTPCQLFEGGIINELWLLTGDDGTSRRPPVFVESKQVYDDQNQRIDGMFETRRTGYVPWPSSAPICKVTARVAYLSPIYDVGCDLVDYAVGIENTHYAIPYLATNGSAFFNQDFSVRFGTSFNSWNDVWCVMSSPTSCITYPSPTVAEGTYLDGGTWKIDPFIQGCGTGHFPPNARGQWDYANPTPVQSRCEHYGMHDGPDASDQLDMYSTTKEMMAAPPSGDGCGGGWQIYLRQSIPGYGNTSYAADGVTPMKNWWPFLFY